MIIKLIVLLMIVGFSWFLMAIYLSSSKEIDQHHKDIEREEDYYE